MKKFLVKKNKSFNFDFLKFGVVLLSFLLPIIFLLYVVYAEFENLFPIEN